MVLRRRNPSSEEWWPLEKRERKKKSVFGIVAFTGITDTNGSNVPNPPSFNYRKCC